jgi:Kelch motif
MLEPRGYGAAASLRSSVLFMGGGNGSTWMNSMLRYDLTKGSWEQVPTACVRGKTDYAAVSRASAAHVCEYTSTQPWPVMSSMRNSAGDAACVASGALSHAGA